MAAVLDEVGKSAEKLVDDEKEEVLDEEDESGPAEATKKKKKKKKKKKTGESINYRLFRNFSKFLNQAPSCFFPSNPAFSGSKLPTTLLISHRPWLRFYNEPTISPRRRLRNHHTLIREK